MKVVSSYAKRPKTSLRKASVQKYEIARQNYPFFPLIAFSDLAVPFHTMIAFHRVNKSSLIIGIVDQTKI